MSYRTRFAAAAALTLTAVTLTATIAGSALPTSASHNDGGHRLVRTDDLVPVQPPFTGATNPIRGINGGGLPWVISEGEIEVRANGRVHMEVEGLVIDPTETAVPAIAGINPIATFAVVVSCLHADGTWTNVTTAPTPADRAGNAELDTMVSLPADCMSPVAFVTNGTGKAWFARS